MTATRTPIGPRRGATVHTQQLYSVAEAAALFGVTPDWVYQRIADGRIKAIRDGRLSVPAWAIDAYLSEVGE